MSKFTPEQLAAIETPGKVIVSASAGSGKTTVMIQKMINLICDKKVDVTRILAVTYTKKAAASMKDKLRKALVKAINHPETPREEKERLKAQYRLVPLADISTIHSFCAKLIRTHFYATDVGNRFSIMAEEDASGVALRSRAVENLFERAYESKDGDFLKLLSVYYRKKKDDTLRQLILQTHTTVRTHVDYKTELLGSGEDSDELFDRVCAEAYQWFVDKCKLYREQLSELYEFFERAGRQDFVKYCGALMEALELWMDAGDLFTLAALAWKKMPNTPKVLEEDSPEIRAAAERLFILQDKIKTRMNDKERKVVSTREEERKNFSLAADVAKSLGRYVLLFDEEYTRLKNLRGVLDYNDLEHIALSLLRQPEIAAEMREKYQYVFVDEYQDVNPVQEAIVSGVAGENLFLVGDIKQSIYGFRGSKSKFFAQKWSEFESAPDANALKLSKNFRSASSILEAVNVQFSKIMTSKNTDVDYEKDGKMTYGELYGGATGRVQVHFVGKEKREEASMELDVYSVRKNAALRQAQLSQMAKKIRQIILRELQAEYYDAEKGETRAVRYADVAILDRWKKGEISEVVAALAAEGIPVTTESPLNICDFPEIKTLIDFLRLVDNAEQDVPLASVLLSSIGGLTEDDLVAIRLATRCDDSQQNKRKVSFRTACKKYAQTGNDALAKKLNETFAYLQKVRGLSQVLGAGELLTRVIAEKQMEAGLLAGINGENCLKRIQRFIEETRNPEPMDTHAFLARLKMLDYKIYYFENGGENAVRVMTMHGSKGLEFPVVILSNLSRGFRMSDEKTEGLYVEGYGLALKAYDVEKMTYASTVLRLLYKRREELETVRDELNLYYVALTRAQYALHMIFDEEEAGSDIFYGRSFADVTDFSLWEKYKTETEDLQIPKAKREALAVQTDPELVQKICRAQAWKYASSGCENMPAKTSPTAMMKLMEAKSPEQYASAFADDPNDKGEAEEKESEGTDAVKGSAYHAFLEHFDFSALADVEGNAEALRERLEAALSAMRAAALLPQEYLFALELDKLTEVLSNSVFYRLQDVRLYKEQRFMAALPSGDVLGMMGKSTEDCSACNEEMLFQGAIDLLAVGDGCAEIIDYKYSRKGKEKLRESYSMQLQLYRMAVSRALKLPMEKIACTIVNIYSGYEISV